MNQPLGNYIGNWLEVYESIKVLRGEVKGDLLELSKTLSGAMIFLGGKTPSIEDGKEISQELINNGKAFEKFLEIVKLQGGNVKLIEHPEKYPKAKVIDEVVSKKEGYLKSINNFEIGMATLELGAGRKTKEDKIDFKAGIIFNKKIGDFVKKGEVIAELHTSSETKCKNVESNFYKFLEFGEHPVARQTLIKKEIQ